MSKTESFYQELTPEEAKEHFSIKMLQVLAADIESQILEHELPKEYGKGIFLFTDMSEVEEKVNIAVNVAWQINVPEKRILKLIPVKYHLYSGDLPDEILDKMNEITNSKDSDGITKFTEYDSTNNRMITKKL